MAEKEFDCTVTEAVRAWVDFFFGRFAFTHKVRAHADRRSSGIRMRPRKHGARHWRRVVKTIQ